MTRDSSFRRPHAQEQSHGDRLGRLKAEIDADQARERAQQQAGADEEHDRQRDLRHHEQLF